MLAQTLKARDLLMKRNLKIFSIFLSLFILGACQKQENKADSADQNQASKIMCNEVDKGLSQYMDDWDPEAVSEFNDLVKTCVPQLSMQQRYAWLKASEDIYSNLLDNTSDEVINYIVNAKNPNSGISAEDLKSTYNNFDDDEQYMIDHFKDLYLQEYDVGDDGHDIYRTAKYKIDLFGPYLNKADLSFFEQQYLEEKIANGAVVKDSTLAVDFSTLASWILVWERYIAHHPNEHFSADAKARLKLYQSYLFFGVENSSVFDAHENNYINPKAWFAIKTLSKSDTPSGALAKQYMSYVQSNQMQWIKIHSQNSDEQDQQLETRYNHDLQSKFGLVPPFDDDQQKPSDNPEQTGQQQDQ